MKMITDIHFAALCKIQYGVYVITAKLHEKLNGQIATVVFQVTNNPIQIATCLSKNTLTHEYIEESKIFGVSLLEQETPMQFIGHFGFRSGREVDKFDQVQYKNGITGCPLVLDHALVTLEVNVKKTLDVGTHTLYVGELVNSNVIKEGVALTYEYYHQVKKGKSPKNAPTYQCVQNIQGENKS